jgi:hypothetical protein
MNYIGIDQYGATYKLYNTKHPRKALLEYLGYKHASKMYVDKLDGSTVQTGYIIGGLWIHVFKLEEAFN